MKLVPFFFSDAVDEPFADLTASQVMLLNDLPISQLSLPSSQYPMVELGNEVESTLEICAAPAKAPPASAAKEYQNTDFQKPEIESPKQVVI